MELSLEHTRALLARTPSALDGLLRGLPDAWTRTTEGEGTWSAADIVAHLIHCERQNWIPRVRIILEDGESKAFPPFDRQGYLAESRSAAVDSLLAEFHQARSRSLADLEGLAIAPEDLARHGLHPGLGVVTLGNVLGAWVAHDLNHLHQMARVLAHPYRGPAGPFTRYLGVMHCDAHGG